MPACCASFSCLLFALSTGRFYCEQHSEPKEETKEKRDSEQSDPSAGAEVWDISQLIYTVCISAPVVLTLLDQRHSVD